MPRFAANVDSLFVEHPWDDRFAVAAAYGFRGVEMDLVQAPDLGKLGDVLTMNGLALAAAFGPALSDPGFADALFTVLDRLEFLEAKTLVLPCGVGDPDAARDRLAYAAQEAKAYGVRVLVEPRNALDAPETTLPSHADALMLLQDRALRSVGLVLDIYEAQMAEGGLANLIEGAADWVAHIQLAGVPLRHEPDEGEVNAPYLLHLLDARGYAGWVSLDYTPRGTTKAGFAWAKPWGLG